MDSLITSKMCRLLKRLKSSGSISVRELSSSEIVTAEKLLSMRLVIKISGKTDSVYQYKENRG